MIAIFLAASVVTSVVEILVFASSDSLAATIVTFMVFVCIFVCSLCSIATVTLVVLIVICVSDSFTGCLAAKLTCCRRITVSFTVIVTVYCVIVTICFATCGAYCQRLTCSLATTMTSGCDYLICCVITVFTCYVCFPTIFSTCSCLALVSNCSMSFSTNYFCVRMSATLKCTCVCLFAILCTCGSCCYNACIICMVSKSCVVVIVGIVTILAIVVCITLCNTCGRNYCYCVVVSVSLNFLCIGIATSGASVCLNALFCTCRSCCYYTTVIGVSLSRANCMATAFSLTCSRLCACCISHIV